LATEENVQWADSLGELTFADSKKTLPLQAADLLAYEAFKYAIFANGDKNAKVRPQYMCALKNFRSMNDFWLFDQPRMENLLKAVKNSVQ